MTTGETIRQARQAAGLSQEKAAHTIGVTVSAWARWERDESSPRLENIRPIAEVLQIKPEKLL